MIAGTCLQGFCMLLVERTLSAFNKQHSTLSASERVHYVFNATLCAMPAAGSLHLLLPIGSQQKRKAKRGAAADTA